MVECRAFKQTVQRAGYRAAGATHPPLGWVQGRDCMQKIDSSHTSRQHCSDACSFRLLGVSRHSCQARRGSLQKLNRQVPVLPQS